MHFLGTFKAFVNYSSFYLGFLNINYLTMNTYSLVYPVFCMLNNAFVYYLIYFTLLRKYVHMHQDYSLHQSQLVPELTLRPCSLKIIC